MIKLYNKDTKALIGEITEEQLGFLIDELEEESLEDTDYYLNELTVGMLEADGAPPELIGLTAQSP